VVPERTQVTAAERRWWRLAWLCLLLAVPLRLVYFAGFGLGDDPNESISIENFARTLRLNPVDFMHYRVVNIVLRGLFYRIFSVNELAFVLPVLAFALGTHAMSLVLARDLLGPRFACFTSVLFLVTPYETLASTANVPDYFHAFFGVAAAWAVLRGYRQGSGRWMALGALAVVLGLLNRLMAILLVPAFAVATVVTLRRWRSWVSFWATLALLIGLVCLWDVRYSGQPFRWIVYNSAGTGGGYDVTGILRVVLMIYPRYVFGLDDHGNRMFAFTGWCGALGAALALGRLMLRRGGTAEGFLAIAFFIFVGVFEFLPHKLSLTAFWSHPRIFRYLAAVAPVFYLCGAYLLEALWQVRAVLGAGACAALIAAGVYWTPRVAEPLVDANRDGRHLIRVLGEQPKNVVVYSDNWHITEIWGRMVPLPPLKDVKPDSKDEKVSFLRAIPPGALVVTGGATLPWYSGIDLIVNLSTLDFSAPPNWQLIDEYDGPRRPWRIEPLRIWRVGPPA
jgi:4-amino-4-deoxy-L-arabinose transferase-like glycosyltransferase